MTSDHVIIALSLQLRAMPAAPLAAVLSGVSRTLLLTVGAAAQHALNHTAVSASSSSPPSSSSISKSVHVSVSHDSTAKSESQSEPGDICVFDARLGDTLLAVLSVLFDARLALVFRPDFETILAFALQALSAWSLNSAASSLPSPVSVASSPAVSVSVSSSTASAKPVLNVALLIRNHTALVATLARMSAASAAVAHDPVSCSSVSSAIDQAGATFSAAARSQIGALGFFFRVAAVALDAFARTAPAQPNQVSSNGHQSFVVSQHCSAFESNISDKFASIVTNVSGDVSRHVYSLVLLSRLLFV